MRLTSNIWDKLGTLTPTRDAAVATSGGESYAEKQAGGVIFLAPPPMLKGTSDPRMPNLTGRKYGDLTVLGQKARGPSDGKWSEPAWVVRCSCGNYTVRRHTKLLKIDPSWPAACPTCTYSRQMLSRDRSAAGSSAKQLRRQAARLDAIAAAARPASAHPSDAAKLDAAQRTNNNLSFDGPERGR